MADVEHAVRHVTLNAGNDVSVATQAPLAFLGRDWLLMTRRLHGSPSSPRLPGKDGGRTD